jgi:benzylsuccinate CoA-transferase BbsF subunit
VGSQDEWRGFLEAMGKPKWAEGDRFGDAFRRWKHHDELDGLISEWTATHSPNEITKKLQSHRVPAFPSLSPSQLRADPHLEARDAFPTITHPEKGEMRAVVPPWRFSETPSRIDRWTPDLGEHNIDVFHGILGVPKSEVERLQDSHVIW